MKGILAVKSFYLFPLMSCAIISSVIPVFTYPIAYCVHEAEGNFVFGCPRISLTILTLVTWGFGELLNKSVHKSITLADKLNNAFLLVECYLC